MKEGSKYIVKQIRGMKGREKHIRDTLAALGLGRIGKQREFTANAALIGMVNRVGHLVEVSPLK